VSLCGFRMQAGDAIRIGADGGPLLSLLNEHGLLVVSAFPLDMEAFLAFAAAFGIAEVVAPPTFSLAGYPHIRVQSNLPGVGVDGGGEYWHSDGPWSETPSAATLLLCETAPDSGGETLFVDMHRAFDDAPQELQARLLRLRGRYPCRAIYQRELTLMGLQDPEKLVALSDLTHPIVRPHPRSGRPALYLNEKWLESVEGLPAAESKALLASLLALATRPERIYAHRWQVGDLLVWDNASMMHKALPPAEGATKKTYRITIKG
jgi:taurine dioxygenase